MASCVSPIKALSTLSSTRLGRQLRGHSFVPSSHHRLWSGLMNELESGLHEVPQSEFFQCGFRQKIRLRMCTRERTLILHHNNTFNDPFLILLLSFLKPPGNLAPSSHCNPGPSVDGPLISSKITKAPPHCSAPVSSPSFSTLQS